MGLYTRFSGYICNYEFSDPISHTGISVCFVWQRYKGFVRFSNILKYILHIFNFTFNPSFYVMYGTGCVSPGKITGENRD